MEDGESEWPIIVLRRPSAFVFGMALWFLLNVCGFVSGGLKGAHIWIYIFLPVYLLVFMMLRFVLASDSTRSVEVQTAAEQGQEIDEEERLEEDAKVSLNKTLMNATWPVLLAQTLFLHVNLPDSFIERVPDESSDFTPRKTFGGTSPFLVFLPLILWLSLFAYQGLACGNIFWGDERMETNTNVLRRQIASFRRVISRRLARASSYQNQTDDDNAPGVVCHTCERGGLTPRDSHYVCADCLATLRAKLAEPRSWRGASAPPRPPDIAHEPAPAPRRPPPPPPDPETILPGGRGGAEPPAVLVVEDGDGDGDGDRDDDGGWT